MGSIEEYYITPTATGSGSGLSEADAMTFTQMISTSLASGTPRRFNVKAGTYTFSANQNMSVSNQTVASRLELRGYNQTIGDLDDVPHSDWTAGTNAPLIENRYLDWDESYVTYRNLYFKPQSGHRFQWDQSSIKVINCVFDFSSMTTMPNDGFYWRADNLMYASKFIGVDTTSTASMIKSLSGGNRYVDCTFECTGSGKMFETGSTTGSEDSFFNCTFVGDGTGTCMGGYVKELVNCTFYNWDKAIAGQPSGSASNGLAITPNVISCVFSEIETVYDPPLAFSFNQYDAQLFMNNVFHNCTSFNGTNAKGSSDIAYSGNISTSTQPMADPANDDFSLTDSSEARASNFTYLHENTALDAGAKQHVSSASGTTIIVIED